jgi:prolipoprotein diacylglyceryl transferase
MEYFVWSANPVALSFGSIHIFWYGILFASAILSGQMLMTWIYKQEGISEKTLEAGFVYALVGIVVGARLGHCFFYDPAYYLSNPLEIFAVWKGGLASHGGGLGMIIAMYLYTKKYKFNFLWLLDRVVISTALFAFFVRMGNFMNSEIVGIPTQVPWAVIFTKIDLIPRHPAQLYEAISYLFIALILFLIYAKYRENLKPGLNFSLFLVLIFVVRIVVEFVKVKQADYDTSFLMMSTGQALSIPFLIFGVGMFVWSIRK